MARPVSIKDETIIEAARHVFLERGIQATTADVAERAGVSEGSIFKRFKSKHELFRAAMEEREPAFMSTLAGRAGKGDLAENLFALGMEIIAFFQAHMPLMMMAWSNPGPDGLPSAIAGPNPPPVRALKSLAGYFEAEMRAGRVRRQDPEIVARSFIGSLNHFVFFQILHRDDGALPLGAETFVRGLVSLLWEGIPAAPRRAGRGARGRAGRGAKGRAPLGTRRPGDGARDRGSVRGP